MRYYLPWLCLFQFAISITVTYSQELIINEVMSNNKSYLADDLGDFEDWIELYNRSDEDIELDQYYLSDDLDNPFKWRFPDVVIGSDELLIVFASGKDYHNDEAIHTNFRLDSEGESITLSKGNELVDFINIPALDQNISFGRNPEDSHLWQFMNEPTLGGQNHNGKYLDISLASGFYQESQSLFIYGALDDQIRYTTDGSMPTAESPEFEQGLSLDFIDEQSNYFCMIPSSTTDDHINNPAWVAPERPMTKGHVMRFASFKNDTISSAVMSRSYFITEGDSHDYTMPVISLIVDEEDFFGDERGIYVPGDQYDEDNPVWTGNFFESGDAWEREAHMTYFKKNKRLKIDQHVGLRIHGGKSRNAAQKSLRVYARSEYGKSHLEYGFLPNTDNEAYKRIILRSTMGGWAGDVIFKDEFAQSSLSGLNLTKQDYRPVVVMINGEYWGIHSIRDRMDEHYLSYKTGLEVDDLEIKEGFNQDFEDMREYMKANDMSRSIHYEYIAELLDIDQFIDYHIVQMYYRNYDWPANNSKWWRAKDGKWKHLLYDLDATFDDYQYNMLEHNTSDDPDVGWPNNSRSTLIFRKMLENDAFVEAFLTRHIYLLENVFDPEILLNHLAEIKSEYAPELPGHIERWSNPLSVQSMDSDIQESIIQFIKHRPCIVKQQLETFFDRTLDYNCPEVSEIEPEPETSDIESMLILPNPASDFVDININPEYCARCHVKISNAFGQTVYEDRSVRFDNGKYRLSIPSKWSSGIYFVSVILTDYSIMTTKIVID